MGDGIEREAAEGEEEEQDEGERALMAWVDGAATLEAQVGRAKQALGELVRKRDAAQQAFKRVRGLLSRAWKMVCIDWSTGMIDC